MPVTMMTFRVSVITGAGIPTKAARCRRRAAVTYHRKPCRTTRARHRTLRHRPVAGHGRPRPHGRQHGAAAGRGGVIVHGVDPTRRPARAAGHGGNHPLRLPGRGARRAAGAAHVWLMLPAGAPTQVGARSSAGGLAPGRPRIDGGNATTAIRAAAPGLRRPRSAVRRLRCLRRRSGGSTNGYCLMFGAEAAAAPRVAALARVLAPAPDRGWLHCGRRVRATSSR